jgi:hypothetical protein
LEDKKDTEKLLNIEKVLLNTNSLLEKEVLPAIKEAASAAV